MLYQIFESLRNSLFNQVASESADIVLARSSTLPIKNACVQETSTKLEIALRYLFQLKNIPLNIYTNIHVHVLLCKS